MTKEYLFGLLGYPLEHSFSPLIHAAALKVHNLNGNYQLFSLKEEQDIPVLINRLREGTLQGLNVTIPYKRFVVELMDELTTTARSIGALNTISFQHSQVIGENTDSAGFLADLDRLGWFKEGDQQRCALILGAGGSARAVAYALIKQGWQLTIAARKIEQAEKITRSLNELNSGPGIQPVVLDHGGLTSIQHSPDLIINATPVGMSPHENECPWPPGIPFPIRAAVYDLVYNPAETVLTSTARAAGLRAANGIGMLVEQAALSFEIWTGLPAPRVEMHSSLATKGSGT